MSDDDPPRPPVQQSRDGGSPPPLPAWVVFVTPRERARAIVAAIVVLAVVVGASAVVPRYVPELADPVALGERIRGFGLLAPVAFVCLQAAQVVVAPIPGQALGFVSGYLFGAVLGTVYSLAGAAIGSYVAFGLSRRYGRAYVERAISPPLLARFDALTGERGLSALFLVFLIPGLPDDVVCFAAGLSPLDVRKMVVVSVAGRLPGYLVVNAAGEQLAAGRVAETAAIVALVLVLSVLGYLGRGRLLRWLHVEEGPAR